MLCILNLSACGPKTYIFALTGIIPAQVQLEDDPKGLVDWYYHKDNIDWDQYPKIMVDSVQLFVDPNADYRGIDVDELKIVADYFNEA